MPEPSTSEHERNIVQQVEDLAEGQIERNARIKELEAELQGLLDAFWAWESVAHSAETDMEEVADVADLWRVLIDRARATGEAL